MSVAYFLAPCQVGSKYQRLLGLRRNPDEEEISEEQSNVKIGDPVVQIVGNEFLSPEESGADERRVCPGRHQRQRWKAGTRCGSGLHRVPLVNIPSARAG